MFKELLKTITGIEFFGLVAMFIFLFIFSLVIFWTLKMDKSYRKKMKNLPLDSSNLNGDINHG
jgi:membrane protein CcdC involved in cytochrome C biogenesis